MKRREEKGMGEKKRGGCYREGGGSEKGRRNGSFSDLCII